MVCHSYQFLNHYSLILTFLIYSANMKTVIFLAILMTQRHTYAADTQSVVAVLQITANKNFHWFKYNHLEAKPGNTKSPMNVSVGDVSIYSKYN